MVYFGVFKFVFIIGFLLVGVTCEGEVPVLIWGAGIDLLKYKPSALYKLSTGEFYDNYLKNLISYSPPTITVFLEESLSSEDFQWRDFDGANSYPTLQHAAKIENMKFVPYVNNPLKALKRLKEDDYKLRVYEKGNQKGNELIIKTENVYNDTSTVFVINLFDAEINEDRPDLLRRHDKYISSICTQMQKKYGNVICILTANQPSWIEPETISTMRKLLSINEENKTDSNLYFAKGFGMIYTKSPPVLFNSITNETFELIYNKDIKPTTDKTTMIVSFKVKNNPASMVRLEFRFLVNGVVWKLQDIGTFINAQSTPALVTNSKIGTSSGFSFHTPVPVVFKNDPYNLTFSNLQAELFFNKDIVAFSVADDTVEFFTIPILTGLLISGLLFIIILVGLSMIYDIKTMDQFDDPKGKTITINALD